jgi:putative ABC transport system permease protein
MKRDRLLLRVMVKAAWVRKDRALTALLSIAVVATMATVALTVYSDLESKLTREFRRFGANVIISAPHGVSEADWLKIKTAVGNQAEAVPVGYAIVQGPAGEDVVIGGTDLANFKSLNSWWSLHQLADANGDALLGSRAAEAVSPNGKPFQITYNGKSIQLRPAAIFHSGSDDDSRIYLPLDQFIALTGAQPTTVQLRIQASPAEIQKVIQQLSASLPPNEAEIKPVRQITAAQTAVLSRTRSIVLAASAVVVVLIVVCMVATLTGSVLERRKDFAVMKALGASNRTLNLLFAGEASLTSLLGGLAGFIAGSAIAWWIGKANFGAAISPRPEMLAPVVLGSILLALIASTVPLKVLRRIQPAGILRGE